MSLKPTELTNTEVLAFHSSEVKRLNDLVKKYRTALEEITKETYRCGGTSELEKIARKALEE